MRGKNQILWLFCTQLKYFVSCLWPPSRRYVIIVVCFYPAVRDMGGILRLLFFRLSFCLYGTDFSAGALPIGVKFCVAVWPHLRQVVSYLAGMAEPWASTGAIWRDMLFAEAFVWQFPCHLKDMTFSWYHYVLVHSILSVSYTHLTLPTILRV